MSREDGPKELVIYVNRHGRPCDSERHDAVPLNVVPASAYDEARAQSEALAEAGQVVADAHRAVIEGVTPKHPNWCANDREEYDARFSHWHSATRRLDAALRAYRSSQESSDAS